MGDDDDSFLCLQVDGDLVYIYKMRFIEDFQPPTMHTCIIETDRERELPC